MKILRSECIQECVLATVGPRRPVDQGTTFIMSRMSWFLCCCTLSARSASQDTAEGCGGGGAMGCRATCDPPANPAPAADPILPGSQLLGIVCKCALTLIPWPGYISQWSCPNDPSSQGCHCLAGTAPTLTGKSKTYHAKTCLVDQQVTRDSSPDMWQVTLQGKGAPWFMTKQKQRKKKSTPQKTLPAT